jgi:hypothetical protein
VLEDQRAARVEERCGPGEDPGKAGRGYVGVGRVEEDDREGSLDLEEGALHLGVEEDQLGADPERAGVLADGADGVARVLDEDRRGGAARQGLEGEGARAGVEIEDARAVLAFAFVFAVFVVPDEPVGDEHREEGLADAIGGGPSGHPAGCVERAGPPASAGDAHRMASETTLLCPEARYARDVMVRQAYRVVSRFLLLLVLAVLALPRVARADQPGAHTVPVAVLAFDSEDSEEQADAITGAVRSRIRAAQGWSLIETTQSLGMMTAALKCPTHPPPECQQKIAEQIKAERYIFGFVTKGPAQAQVTAEIHLYQKGKPDTVLKESYADNLKDSNDDTLRKIAARIVERLGGTAVGVVIVKATDQSGEVVIDGDKRIPLANGTARIELAAGGHSIEVTGAGGAPVKRNVLVTAGRETVVELTAAATTEPPSEASKSSTRKIIGGVSMGAGVVLGGIAVYELLHYLSLQSDGKAYAATIAKDPQGRECRDTGDQRCVAYDRDSKSASALAWGLGGGGAVLLGVGAYLFFSTPGSSEPNRTASAPKPPKPTARVVPTAGPGNTGVMVLGTF